MRPVLKMPAKKINSFTTDTYLQHQLIHAVGAYCVYCESPLSVDIPFAHKVSVSNETTEVKVSNQPFNVNIGINYRRFNHAWINQQLMCKACCSAKVDNPGMREAIEFLRTYHPEFLGHLKDILSRTKSFDEHDWDALFAAAAMTWISPDHSTDEDAELLHGLPGDFTYNLISYNKVRMTPRQLHQNGYLYLTTAELQEPWIDINQEMVWVVPNIEQIQQFQDPSQLDIAQRVLATIIGLNLNYHNPTHLDGEDRRVVNRTHVWDTAISSWARLDSLIKELITNGVDVSQVLFTPVVNAFVNDIRHTLQALGFWSVWATIFRANLQNEELATWKNIPADARNSLLYSLLIEYEIDTRKVANQVIKNDLISIRSVMPGTDISRLTFFN